MKQNKWRISRNLTIFVCIFASFIISTNSAVSIFDLISVHSVISLGSVVSVNSVIFDFFDENASAYSIFIAFANCFIENLADVASNFFSRVNLKSPYEVQIQFENRLQYQSNISLQVWMQAINSIFLFGMSVGHDFFFFELPE